MCLFLGTVPGWAQVGPPGGYGNFPPDDRDQQRREQIREVLKSGRQTVGSQGRPAGNAVVLAPVSPSYHLTPQARAELREQLRRDQNESRRGAQP